MREREGSNTRRPGMITSVTHVDRSGFRSLTFDSSHLHLMMPHPLPTAINNKTNPSHGCKRNQTHAEMHAVRMQISKDARGNTH